MATRDTAPLIETPPGQTGAVRSSPFESAAERTLRDVQRSLQDLVARIPGSGQRAVDLQRALGLDKKLGWQVFRVISAPVPLAEVANVPSRWAMERLTSAAAKRGIPKTVVARAMSAFERFEAFVAEHGGDRAGLVSLVSGITSDGDLQQELRVRRDLFRCQAHIWGIRTAAAVRTVAYHPQSGDGALLDMAAIRGNLGMQRLRHGVPLSFILTHQNDPVSAGPEQSDEAHASDAAPASRAFGGMELLDEFTSRPRPDLVRQPTPDGRARTEVVFPPSGRAGAVTLYTAQRTAAMAEGEQTNFGANLFVTLPCESLVGELLVPVGLSDPETVRVAIYGRRDDPAQGFDRRTTDLLPQRESPMYMGTMETYPAIPGAPRHGDAVRHVMDKLGWLATRFDVYRCSIRYPVLHTVIRLAVDGLRR